MLNLQSLFISHSGTSVSHVIFKLCSEIFISKRAWIYDSPSFLPSFHVYLELMNLFAVSLGYMLAGFFVGWSSKLLRLQEHSVELGNVRRIDINKKPSHTQNFHSSLFYRQLNRSQISWIISAFPLGVVIVSLALYQCYYWIGTKLSMLAASFMILLSWGLMLPDGWEHSRGEKS